MQFKTLFISALAGLAAAHGTEEHSSAALSTAPISLSTGTAPLPTGTGGVISSASGIYSNTTLVTKPSGGSTAEVTATETSTVKAGASATDGAAPSSSSSATGAANLDRKSEFGMVVIGLAIAAGFAV